MGDIVPSDADVKLKRPYVKQHWLQRRQCGWKHLLFAFYSIQICLHSSNHLAKDLCQGGAPKPVLGRP